MAEASGCIHDSIRGYAIHTWTGKAFHAKDIKPEDVCIEDIAHGLSLTCRYAGQADKFYSVAQHSFYCYEMAVKQGLSTELIKEALLHDAVEAYLGDFPRPWKMAIPLFSDFEYMVEKQVNPILGIPVNKSKEIKFIDETMLATETPLLFLKNGTYTKEGNEYIYHGDAEIASGLPQRLNWNILPSWEPRHAEDMFLMAYRCVMCKLREEKEKVSTVEPVL